MAVEDLGQISWASSSFRDPSDPFFRDENRDNDEENLIWAALEKLPTYDRISKSVLRQVVDGKVVASEIDVRHLGMQNRKIIKEMMLKAVEEDNERFLLRFRERIDRVGIELPKIEVRFEDLSVEADTYYGGRALPTLFNATMNAIEGLLGLVWLSPSKKQNLKILNGVSGILKPSRFVSPLQ